MSETEAQEEKSSPASPWQVRCTSEQKKFFQQKVLESGLPASELVVKALESYSNLQIEDEEIKRALCESDHFISRLKNLVQAYIMEAIEKKRVYVSEVEKTLSEREKYESQAALFEEKFKAELILKEEETLKKLESDYQVKEESLLKAKEEAEKLLSKTYEEIEKIQQENINLKRELDISNKKYTEHLRSYEILDERNMEMRQKIKDLEAKSKDYLLLQERVIELEKKLSLTEVNLEKISLEERSKRLSFENELLKKYVTENKKIEEEPLTQI